MTTIDIPLHEQPEAESGPNPDSIDELDKFMAEYAKNYVPENIGEYVPPELPDNLTDEQVEAIYDLEDEILAQRFDDEVIGELGRDWLARGTGQDLRPLVKDRQFVVGYISATGPHGDLGLKPEVETFAEVFHERPAEVWRGYGGKKGPGKNDKRYGDASVFTTVIDVSGERPVPAGVARIVDYMQGVGFKDVNDLTVDDSENPWIEEIKSTYFEPGEPYTPEEAWNRMTAANNGGVSLKLEESVDVATHASAPEYRGAHGSLTGVSMLFFHGIVRHMQARNAEIRRKGSDEPGQENILAIFDLGPFKNLQQFGGPFETYDGLAPHPYGGPGDTIPAFAVLETAIARIRAFDEGSGDVFEKGTGLEYLALLPNEYEPKKYSDGAVGLAA